MGGWPLARESPSRMQWGKTYGLSLIVAVAALYGCREGSASVSPGPTTSRDAGAAITCVNVQDCGGNGVCVNGVCEAVAACSMDSDCTAGVCHTTRNYCVQCDGRHMNECPTGQTCQFDFTCVTVGTSTGGMNMGQCTGNCMDRTMCADDEVCRAGECCAPPSRCATVDDCPTSRPECNGATGECFGGGDCFMSSDCETRPGCSGGACECNGSPGECVMRQDECATDDDCRMGGAGGTYVGKFCSVAMSPKLCLDAPACASDVECTPHGLVCDTDMGSDSAGRCRNGTPCPMGNECDAQTQVCQGGFCVGKSCLNTPNFCGPRQMCNQATGRCVPVSQGMCVLDTDCDPGYWCNSFAGACELGCRDSTDCPNGVCNSAHMCESAAGGLCGPCMDNADCPAGTECHESPLTMEKKCQEPCSLLRMQDCMVDPAAMCIFVWCTCGF